MNTLNVEEEDDISHGQTSLVSTPIFLYLPITKIDIRLKEHEYDLVEPLEPDLAVATPQGLTLRAAASDDSKSDIDSNKSYSSDEVGPAGKAQELQYRNDQNRGAEKTQPATPKSMPSRRSQRHAKTTNVLEENQEVMVAAGDTDDTQIKGQHGQVEGGGQGRGRGHGRPRGRGAKGRK